MIRYYRLFKTFKNWPLYLLYKLGFSVPWPLVFETRKGVLVEVPRRLMHTFKSIFLDEGYMKGLGKKVPPTPPLLISAPMPVISPFLPCRNFPNLRFWRMSLFPSIMLNLSGIVI